MLDQKSHISLINSLRGVAASAVCFYHFVYTTVDYVQNETVLNTFYFGQKGVQLFFIISGVVITLSMINSNYSYKKINKFILKRFIRIEPPYLAAVIIGIAYLYLRNFIPGTTEVDLTPGIGDVLLHLGYLIPFFNGAEWVNPVFWTLAVEFQYYLALALLFPLMTQNKLILRIIFYAVFIGMTYAGTSYEFFPHWGAYFLAGILYISYVKEIIPLKEFFLVSIITGISIYINLGAVDFGIAVVALTLIHLFPNFKSKTGEFTGKISYSLYLLHSIIGAAFVNFLSHRLTESYQKVLVIIAGYLISVLSAYILYRLIEKPTHQYAKRIK